jgi:hypothetical protein
MALEATNRGGGSQDPRRATAILTSKALKKRVGKVNVG